MTTKPKPKTTLMGLDTLDVNIKGKTVTIVQGLAAFEAAKKLGHGAVTWVGENGTFNEADWTPLKDRNIVLWPSNDEASRYCFSRIKTLLLKQGVRTLAVYNTKHKPDKWDATNANNEDCNYLTSEYTAHIYPKDEPESIKKAFKYFQFLGFSGKRYIFYVNITGQVLSYTGPDLERGGNQLTLAHADYWEQQYDNKKDYIANALIRQSERVGFYDPARIRGRGAWEDEGRSVLHVGDRLIVDGEDANIQQFKTEWIYEQNISMRIRTTSPAHTEGGQRLIDICRMVRWESSISGQLLAGWIFSSIICGVLSWRSHIYITGAVGAGKTWVEEQIIEPCIRGLAIKAQGKSTEAGLRQTIKADARPVIFDESEAEKREDGDRMQRIFDLARQASSEGAAPIYKGSQNQSGSIAYIIRSCFCFASISPSIREYADHSRTTMLHLAPPHKQHHTPFKELERAAAETFTDDYRDALISRAISMVPVIKRNAKLFAEAGQILLGGRRQSDQYSMMIAGLYGLTHDDVVEDPLAFIESLSLEKQDEEKPRQSEQVLLDTILQHDVLVDIGKPKQSIGEMISKEYTGTHEQSLEEQTILHKRGVRVINNELHIATHCEHLKKILRDTPWAANWGKCLINIKGARRSKSGEHFTKGVVSRAVIIPMPESLMEEG